MHGIHSVASNAQHPPMTLNRFSEEQRSKATSGAVVSVDPGKGQSQLASANKNNRGSNSFVFNNSDIAREKGRPNAASAETLGEVYAGRVGGSG